MKADGSVMQPHDFMVGETVEIFNRHIKIVDSDKYSRDFFKSAMGVD
jgi:hypothetical protein